MDRKRVISTCQTCQKRFKPDIELYFCSKACKLKHKRDTRKQRKRQRLGTYADYGTPVKRKKSVSLQYPLHYAQTTDCRRIHPNNQHWKSYDQYLLSETWAKIRQRILKRDSYKCQQCGKKANQVHHKHYRKWGEEKEVDLIAVCRPCHELIHNLK